ncbi:MAG: carbohydrate-binding domain-containing protein [Candidatus Ornithomonoglobus sp.]
MKMKKNYVICVLTAAMLASGTGCVAKTNDSVVVSQEGASIIYDGAPLEFDVAPVNENGTILVPMRAVFEALGAKVKWDAQTQSVSARKSSKTYAMTLGEKTITVSKNNEVTDTTTANEAMQLVEDRTMIPLRALGELFGLEVDWNDETKTVTLITPSEESDDSWKENAGTVDLSAMTVDGSGISVSGKVITITEGGDFTVTGKNSDAQIVVDTDAKVRLRLNGVDLANTDGAPIYIKSADKCYITLEEGTENTLTDGGEYTEELEINGCIYSSDNLEIKGKGALNINANVHHGIAAKDNLEISNGTINITAQGDGIHVNDTAAISGGTVNITSAQDGIQSESILDITDGVINISCTGEVTESTAGYGMGPGGGRGQQQMTVSDTEEDDEAEDISSKGLKAGWMMDISGGEITVNSNDTCIKCDSELDISGGTLTLTSEVKKGIKGMEDVNIDGGTIDIKKSTEGIETKRVMTINGGDISVIASDDGLNAGGNGAGGGRGGFGGGMMPEGDGMAPPEMPENMKGQLPQKPENMTDGAEQPGGMRGQKGGRGMNADGESMTPPEKPEGDGGMELRERPEGDDRAAEPQIGGRGGMTGGRGESAVVSTEHHIQINGGNIYINAGGDGIDSNGSLIIDGGTVTVDGASAGGNSALDHDGLMQINGGMVTAVGSAGMIENPSASSAQNILSAYISANAGQTITIKDADGSQVCSHTVTNAAGHIMFSSADIAQGVTYTVYVDGTKQCSGTAESALTTIGTPAAGSRGGMGGRNN